MSNSLAICCCCCFWRSLCSTATWTFVWNEVEPVLRQFFIINNRAHTHTHVHSYFLVRVIDFIFGAHFRMERLPFYFVAHKLHGRVVVFGVTESFFCAAFFSLLNNILFLSGGYDNAMSLCDVVICKCIHCVGGVGWVGWLGGWDVITFRFTCKCIMWVEELLVCPRFPLNFFILFCLFAPFNSLCSTIKACIEWQHVSILRIPCRRSVGVCGGLCIAYPCSLGKCLYCNTWQLVN